jgi:hypothetical protein
VALDVKLIRGECWVTCVSPPRRDGRLQSIIASFGCLPRIEDNLSGKSDTEKILGNLEILARPSCK